MAHSVRYKRAGESTSDIWLVGQLIPHIRCETITVVLENLKTDLQRPLFTFPTGSPPRRQPAPGVDGVVGGFSVISSRIRTKTAQLTH
jgi:hypothetical protein